MTSPIKNPPLTKREDLETSSDFHFNYLAKICPSHDTAKIKHNKKKSTVNHKPLTQAHSLAKPLWYLPKIIKFPYLTKEEEI